jgi:hypothetical protein
MKAQWHRLLDAEHAFLLAHKKAECTQVVQWRNAPLPRLVYLLAEQEHFQPTPALVKFVTELIEGIPDSKIIEDVHSKLRDKQRASRNDVINRASRQVGPKLKLQQCHCSLAYVVILTCNISPTSTSRLL